MGKKVILALCAVPLLSGCVAAALAPFAAAGGSVNFTNHAVNDRDRKIVSAEAIGGDLNARHIKIRALTKTETQEQWVAETSIGRYSCKMPKGKSHASCAKMAN